MKLQIWKHKQTKNVIFLRENITPDPPYNGTIDRLFLKNAWNSKCRTTPIVCPMPLAFIWDRPEVCNREMTTFFQKNENIGV